MFTELYLNINQKIINEITSINELVAIMSSEIGYSKKPIYTEPRTGDIEKSVLSNNKFISLFNYIPSIDVKTGIKMLVNNK